MGRGKVDEGDVDPMHMVGFYGKEASRKECGSTAGTESGRGVLNHDFEMPRFCNDPLLFAVFYMSW